MAPSSELAGDGVSVVGPLSLDLEDVLFLVPVVILIVTQRWRDDQRPGWGSKNNTYVPIVTICTTYLNISQYGPGRGMVHSKTGNFRLWR